METYLKKDENAPLERISFWIVMASLTAALQRDSAVGWGVVGVPGVPKYSGISRFRKEKRERNSKYILISIPRFEKLTMAQRAKARFAHPTERERATVWKWSELSRKSHQFCPSSSSFESRAELFSGATRESMAEIAHWN